MTAQKIFNNDAKLDLTDIVFKYRNKAYGAYELRKHYNERVNKSMLITLGAFTLFFLSAWIIVSHHTIPVMSETVYHPHPGPNIPAISQPHQPHKPAVPTQPKTTPNPDKGNYKIVKQNFIPLLKPDSSVALTKSVDNFNVDKGGNVTSTNSPGNSSTPAPTAPDNFKVVQVAEVMPQFPGGYDALQKYFEKHIRYTPAAVNSRAEGKIFIHFIINADGTVEDIRVVKDDVGYGCADNAIDVIKNMPLWKPGMNGNNPVRVEMTLPISYQLDSE